MERRGMLDGRTKSVIRGALAADCPPSEVGGVSVECRDVAVGGWSTDTREAGRYYSLVEGVR